MQSRLKVGTIIVVRGAKEKGDRRTVLLLIGLYELYILLTHRRSEGKI